MGCPAIDLSLDIDEISISKIGRQWIGLQSMNKLEASHTSLISCDWAGPGQFGRRVSSRPLENKRRGKEVDEWQKAMSLVDVIFLVLFLFYILFLLQKLWQPRALLNL